MKLFINSGVFERINLKNSNSAVTMVIPNYLEDERRYEDIKFVFKLEGINKKSFEKDLLLEKVSLRKTSKNSYTVSPSKSTSERYMYALVRCTDIIPDDVFIPTNMKDKVTVLRRINFIDFEADYGKFLSNVYLIRVSLKEHESIPLYFSYDAPRDKQRIFDRHSVLYRTDRKYYVSKDLKTIMYIDKKNKDQYISLSELCN